MVVKELVPSIGVFLYFFPCRAQIGVMRDGAAFFTVVKMQLALMDIC